MSDNVDAVDARRSDSQHADWRGPEFSAAVRAENARDSARADIEVRMDHGTSPSIAHTAMDDEAPLELSLDSLTLAMEHLVMHTFHRLELAVTAATPRVLQAADSCRTWCGSAIASTAYRAVEMSGMRACLAAGMAHTQAAAHQSSILVLDGVSACARTLSPRLSTAAAGVSDRMRDGRIRAQTVFIVLLCIQAFVGGCALVAFSMHVGGLEDDLPHRTTSNLLARGHNGRNFIYVDPRSNEQAKMSPAQRDHHVNAYGSFAEGQLLDDDTNNGNAPPNEGHVNGVNVGDVADGTGALNALIPDDHAMEADTKPRRTTHRKAPPPASVPEFTAGCLDRFSRGNWCRNSTRWCMGGIPFGSGTSQTRLCQFRHLSPVDVAYNGHQKWILFLGDSVVRIDYEELLNMLVNAKAEGLVAGRLRVKGEVKHPGPIDADSSGDVHCPQYDVDYNITRCGKSARVDNTVGEFKFSFMRKVYPYSVADRAFIDEWWDTEDSVPRPDYIVVHVGRWNMRHENGGANTTYTDELIRYLDDLRTVFPSSRILWLTEPAQLPIKCTWSGAGANKTQSCTCAHTGEPKDASQVSVDAAVKQYGLPVLDRHATTVQLPTWFHAARQRSSRYSIPHSCAYVAGLPAVQTVHGVLNYMFRMWDPLPTPTPSPSPSPTQHTPTAQAMTHAKRKRSRGAVDDRVRSR